MRQEGVDGKAGDEERKEKRVGGGWLSSGWLTIHAHSVTSGVTFVRHSTHSLAKTHVCRHTRPSHRRSKHQSCGVEEKQRVAENIHPSVCMQRRVHDEENVSMETSTANIHPV